MHKAQLLIDHHEFKTRSSLIFLSFLFLFPQNTVTCNFVHCIQSTSSIITSTYSLVPHISPVRIFPLVPAVVLHIVPTGRPLVRLPMRTIAAVLLLHTGHGGQHSSIPVRRCICGFRDHIPLLHNIRATLDSILLIRDRYDFSSTLLSLSVTVALLSYSCRSPLYKILMNG